MYDVPTFDKVMMVATLGGIALMFLRHLAVTRSQEGGSHDNTVRKAHQEERGITLSTRHADVIPCTPKVWTLPPHQARMWTIVDRPPYDWAKEEGEPADPFPMSPHVLTVLEHSWME